MRVTITAYDPRWPERFERERELVRAALGALALRIEHFGSTAVPGLAAKPIVDVLVAVHDVCDPEIEPALRGAGYDLIVNEPGHRMYRTPEADVHVHLWSSLEDVERHLTFRDWLRRDDADRALYLHVKRVLAQREWNEQNDYAQAKTPVVKAILKRARGASRGPRIEAFAAVLQRYVAPHSRILEIGAGEGELAQTLANAGHTVVALDVHLRSRFPVLEQSFEEYAAPARLFDCIAAQLVLHHAEDLGAMLEKAAALLRRGGTIAIDDYGWERSADEAFRAERADLHTSGRMLEALRARFRETFYADHAYFEDGAGTDRLGFTFIGRLD